MNVSDMSQEEEEVFMLMAWDMAGCKSQAIMDILKNETAGVVEYISRGSDLDFPVRDTSFLELVVKYNATNILKTVLEFGWDANMESVAGKSLLLLAAQEDSPEVCDMLMAWGASPCEPSISDGQRITPLMIMAKTGGELGLLYVEKFLSKDGFPIEVADVYGRTAMHYACDKYKYTDEDTLIIERLKAYGASINQKDKSGKTPQNMIKQEELNPEETFKVNRSWGVPGVRIPTR